MLFVRFDTRGVGGELIFCYETGSRSKKVRVMALIYPSFASSGRLAMTYPNISNLNYFPQMMLYTSFPEDIFLILLNMLRRLLPLSYYNGWPVTSMLLEDQLLLCLVKLRLNLRDLDLADRFGISRVTVSNIFKTFVHALHEILYEGILLQVGIPSQLKCKGSMPQSFQDFSSARIIIDSTEVSQDIPSDLNKNSLCYSNYKSRHTVKALVGVAPNAAMVYCSDLYPGSTSDSKIVEHSKILNNFQAGDLILADKGFNIQSKLPAGVSLNTPPFLTGKAFFTRQEAEFCRKIARSRIHIERVNERIKNYSIISHIPAKYRCISTIIFQVCACLVNLQAPLLKEIANSSKMH